MHILVIGNGFDLAHGLPTSYKDFLEFCVIVKEIFSYNIDSTKDYAKQKIKNCKIHDEIKDMLLLALMERTVKKILPKNGTIYFKVVTPNIPLNELYSHINNNAWLQHFLKCQSYIGNNWIDFELEISKVIQALDAGRHQVTSGGSVNDIEADEKGALIAITEASKKSFNRIFKNTASINEFSVYLLRELERLIRALDIYIAEFIQNIKIDQKISTIEQIKPNCVLSFNYSNTYGRIYGNQNGAEYEYIHGKAYKWRDIESCKLILGIDEYLHNDRKDTDLEFLPFKKYFQRIYKQTGSKYLIWANTIEEDWESLAKDEQCEIQTAISIKNRQLILANPNIHQLTIFGHSLDATDGDVLRRLILNNNVKTNIFYYRRYENDTSDLKQKIMNLIRIIGQDELIKRTGGLTRTIEFVPQEIPESLS